MHPARQIHVGDIVHYRLSDEDASSINGLPEPSTRNLHMAGMVRPLIVVRIWSEDCVNGHVFLDGAGTYWVTSRNRGEADANWNWPGHSEEE